MPFATASSRFIRESAFTFPIFRVTVPPFPLCGIHLTVLQVERLGKSQRAKPAEAVSTRDQSGSKIGLPLDSATVPCCLDLSLVRRRQDVPKRYDLRRQQ